MGAARILAVSARIRVCSTPFLHGDSSARDLNSFAAGFLRGASGMRACLCAKVFEIADLGALGHVNIGHTTPVFAQTFSSRFTIS